MTKTKNAALDAIVAKVNKKHGQGTVIKGEDLKDQVIPRLTTGSLSLDVALGGGWAANQWNEIIGDESHGKALALDTPIPTPDGWRTMKDLEPGDRVFDERGKPCTVTFVTGVQYGRPCNEVVFSDGSVITADDDHRWATHTALDRMAETQGRPRPLGVRTTAEIRETVKAAQGHANHSIPAAGPLEYVANDTKVLVDPYVLGVWLGDGASASGRITSADPEIMEHVRRYYRAEPQPYEDRPYGWTTYGLASDLRALKVLENKHIPERYQRASVDQRLALLQGLMDTDGSISTAGQCEYTGTNERLVRDVHRLLLGLGVKVRWSASPAMLNGVDHGPRYRLLFYPPMQVFRLPRKAERVQQNNRRAYDRKIHEVRPVESVPVKCIQVDSPSHLYLAGEQCIPTHNTAVALRTLAANQAADPDFTCVWFAAEEFVPGYAEMIGCDLDRIVIVEDNTMEVVFQMAIDILEERAADMIVVDSLPALVSIREEDGTMEDLQPGQAAFLTGKFFRKASPSIKRSLLDEDRPCTGIIINQWREKIGVTHGDPRTTPGGKAKNFYYFIRAECRRSEWITNTKNKRIGITVNIRNIKNKTAPPGEVGVVDFYFANGNGMEAGQFDVLKETMNVALAFEVVKRAGAYYRYDGEQWQGREGLLEAMKESPELRQSITDKVMAVVRGLAIEDDDESNVTSIQRSDTESA